MGKPPLTVYWDSSVFLAWLKPEPERKRQCSEIIEEAERGKVKIVASTITLTEVIRLKGYSRLSPETEAMISEFFKNQYIVLHGVTRYIAEEARQLIWTHAKLHPKDSIHLATADFAQVSEVHTYDGNHMLSLDGQIGNPPLRISQPRLDQAKIPFESPDEAGEEEE